MIIGIIVGIVFSFFTVFFFNLVNIIDNIKLLAGDDPIKVFIDSPGGDADAGFAIFDMMRFVKPDVYTIGMGLVASAGAIILLASPKDKRIGLPNSHYLIHQPLSPCGRCDSHRACKATQHAALGRRGGL